MAISLVAEIHSGLPRRLRAIRPRAVGNCCAAVRRAQRLPTFGMPDDKPRKRRWCSRCAKDHPESVSLSDRNKVKQQPSARLLSFCCTPLCLW